MVAPVQGYELMHSNTYKANMWALYLRLNIRLKDIRERLLGFITNGPQTAALRLNMNVPQVNY